MVLGTYWYFDFPTELYRFEYFKFKKGYGGHIDNPAELLVTFETKNPEKIIHNLKKIIDKFSEGSIFVYYENTKLKIGTAGYQFFDYDFLVIAEVEKLLKDNKIVVISDETFNNPTFIRLYNDTSQGKVIYPKKGFLQVVGSELKKNNAENLKFRFDCNLNFKDKSDFLTELKIISVEENLEVFYYYDNDFGEKSNLMLFFTNGRQGLYLSQKIYIDTISFENKVEQLFMKYEASDGHISGFEKYPQNGPNIEMIIEEEYII